MLHTRPLQARPVSSLVACEDGTQCAARVSPAPRHDRKPRCFAVRAGPALLQSAIARLVAGQRGCSRRPCRRMTAAIRAGGRWNYLVLLGALVGLMMMEPLIGHRNVASAAVIETLFFLICLHVLFVVFDRRERRAALVLIAAA